MGYTIDKDLEITDAQKVILQIVEKLKEASPNQILQDPSNSVGKVMIQRHLKALLEKGLIEKIGSPPKVFYTPTPTAPLSPCFEVVDQFQTSNTLVNVLESYFAFASSTELLTGVDGFKAWYVASQLPSLEKQKSKKKSLQARMQKNLSDLSDMYLKLRESISSSLHTTGMIDGQTRYLSIFEKPMIDQVFYLDFYALPQFGRTKLGHYIQRAKIGDKRSKKYIHIIEEAIVHALQMIEKEHHIDAAAWVPHSLKRNFSLMDILRKNNKDLYPVVNIEKVFKGDIIPQKTISNLNMRIENSTRTNIVASAPNEILKYKHIAIIDDAIGSNATMHGIAQKLKTINPDLSITALAPIGSYKGFETIRDI